MYEIKEIVPDYQLYFDGQMKFSHYDPHVLHWYATQEEGISQEDFEKLWNDFVRKSREELN